MVMRLTKDHQHISDISKVHEVKTIWGDAIALCLRSPITIFEDENISQVGNGR